MTARIIDGRELAAATRARVAVEVAAFRERFGRAPGLEVVLVGEAPASVIYTRNKEKAAREVGIRGTLHRLAADVSQAALLEHVAALSADPAVDGILVQLPLPAHVDPNRVIDAIDPKKDVDGFHPHNAGLLSAGREGLVACTPRGCLALIDSYLDSLRQGQPPTPPGEKSPGDFSLVSMREGQPPAPPGEKSQGALSLADAGSVATSALAGAHAVVIGRSNIVGKPVAQLLLGRHATVTLAHSKTRDLPALCRQADVLVAAVGRAEMVRGDWIKSGAIVIDVGMNKSAAGKLCGDVDTAAAMARAAAITPVPGGVGPMTIAMLLDNTVIAARRRLGG